MSAFLCRTCGATRRSNSYVVKERMFSIGEEFAYDQCGECESIQIAELPDDEELSRHYPKTYYSFDARRPAKGFKEALAQYLHAARDRGAFGKSLLGQALMFVKPEPTYPWLMKTVGVRQDQKILDVGCGAGSLLDRLARLGYRDVSGLDPFLAADAVTSEGVHLRKQRLAEAEGLFDVLVFNHSFEHVPDPEGELHAARQRLKPNGLCLIQIPTPSSQAREEYGTDWAQWDAPRHLTLISRKGMALLAERCGFELRRIIDIGEGWSQMSSTLNKRGLGEPGANFRRHLSVREMAMLRRKAIAANAAGRGDSVSCVLIRR